MEIVNERVVTDVEAREILEKRSKEVELGYEQKNALEFLKKHKKQDENDIRKLLDELKKVEKLREKQIIMIANLLPKDRDDLRVILEKDYSILGDEEVKLILEAVKRVL